MVSACLGQQLHILQENWIRFEVPIVFLQVTAGVVSSMLPPFARTTQKLQHACNSNRFMLYLLSLLAQYSLTSKRSVGFCCLSNNQCLSKIPIIRQNRFLSFG